MFKIKKILTDKVKKEGKPKVNKAGLNLKGLKINSEDVEVIRLARCYNSPNGDYGLHGFIQGKMYNSRRMGLDKNGKPYYRIWNDYHDYPKDYQTITVFDFQYYFKVVGQDMFKGSPPPRSQRK